MDGKTRVCGLIANPVEHSMSPMMHNFFAQRTGVNLAYVPFKVEDITRLFHSNRLYPLFKEIYARFYTIVNTDRKSTRLNSSHT